MRYWPFIIHSPILLHMISCRYWSRVRARRASIRLGSSLSTYPNQTMDRWYIEISSCLEVRKCGTKCTLASVPQVTIKHSVNDGLYEAYDRKDRSSRWPWQIQSECNLTGDGWEPGEKVDDLCKWFPCITPLYIMLLASCLYKREGASIIKTLSDGMAFTLWSREIGANIS